MKKIITLIGVLIMLISITSVTWATAPGVWTTREEMPTARYFLGSASLGNRFYCIGGYPGLPVVEMYDPVANVWSPVANLTYGREYLNPVVINDRLFVVSSGNESTETPTVEAYDINSNTWEFKTNVNLPCYGAGIVSLGQKIYKFGGYVNYQYISNAVEEYDPATNQWTFKSNMPTARWNMGIATLGNKIYVFGGAQSFSGPLVVVDNVEVYDPQTDTWEVKGSMPVPKTGFGVVNIGGRLIALGGWTNGWALTDSIEVYDPASDSWSEGGNMPVARAGYGYAVWNEKAFLFGGWNSEALSLVQEYTPCFPPKIAFQSGDISPESYEIRTMNPDGTGVTRLTNNNYYDGAPVWSPTGARIAFESRIGNSEIFIMNADGSEPVNITNHIANDRSPAWSPGGDRIVFESDRDLASGEIYLMNSNGSGVIRLTTTGGNHHPSWSPVGNKIVFESNGDLFVMDLDSQNQTRLTTTGNNGNPVWPADGSRILFTSIRDGNGEIYIMNATDGSGQTNLSLCGADDGDPGWTPDNKIIFQSNRYGNYQLFTMNANGSSQTRLTESAANDEHAVWSNDVVPGSPPALTITVTTPVESAVLNTTSVTVTGTVTGENLAGVWVNNQPATLTGNSFEITVQGTEGPFDLIVEARDNLNRSTTVTRHIKIDTTPPDTPANFIVTAGIGQVVLNWDDNINENAGYQINRNPVFSGGETVIINRDNHEGFLVSYVDQDVIAGTSYTYNLKAFDPAGNFSPTTQSITVTVGAVAETVGASGGTVHFDSCMVNIPEGVLTESLTVALQEAPDQSPVPNEYAVPVSSIYSITLKDQNGQEVPAQFEEPVMLSFDFSDYILPEGYTIHDLGIYWLNPAFNEWEKLESDINLETDIISALVEHFSEYTVMASNYNSPSLDSYNKLGVSPFQSYFNDNIESVSPSSGSLSVSATDLKLPGRNGMDLIISRIYDANAAEQEKIIAANTKEGQELKRKTPIDTFGYGWYLNIPWIETVDKGKFIHLPDGQTIKIELKMRLVDFMFVYIFEYHQGCHFTLTKDGDGFILIMSNGVRVDFDSKGRPASQWDPSGKNVIRYFYKTGNPRQIDRIIDSIGRTIRFTYEDIGTNYNVISKISVDKLIPDDREAVEVNYSYYPQNNNDPGSLRTATDPKRRITTYYYENHSLSSGYYLAYTIDTCYKTVDKIFDYNLDLLNKIEYPTQTNSIYTYEFKDQHYYKGWDTRKSVKVLGIFRTTVRFYGNGTFEGKRFLVTGQTVMGRNITYNYIRMNPVVGSVPKENLLLANTYILERTVTDSQKTISQTFKYVVGNNLTENLSGSQGCKGTLLVQNSIKPAPDNQEYESVNYTYNVPLREITREDHYRGGNIIYSTTYEYDSWGNPTRLADGTTNLETLCSYYDFPQIKNLVKQKKTINKNSLGRGDQTAITNINYDGSGRITKLTVEDGAKSIVTDFSYDTFGNLYKTTERNNEDLETELLYDDVVHAFLKQKTVHNIKDADGSSTDIKTYYNYDLNTGMKISETDPRGYVTKYEYDILNRITKVTLPDDDTNDTNNPTLRYEFDDQNNTCDFYNEKNQKTRYIFDGMGRQTDIIKYTSDGTYPVQVQTHYTYNNLGQISKATDPRGVSSSGIDDTYSTWYEYDSLNRITKVTYPDDTPGDLTNNHYIALDYIDLTNTVTITNEEGHTVTEQSDWAKRLVQARQTFSYETQTDTYTWQFDYDSLNHKLRQTDPNQKQTELYYDGLGRLTGAKLPSANLVMDPGNPSANPVSHQVETHVGYDDIGRVTSRTDARGNSIYYEYDQLGRVIKETKSATDHLHNNQVLTMVTKSYYDAAGNRIRTFDPNRGEWLYTYSARGWLLSGEDPLHNVTKYQYDALGNKIAVTDPRGIVEGATAGSFTTKFVYDDLNRLSKTILPDQTPGDDTDNSYTVTTYDVVGNAITKRDANGVTATYEYTPRNWLKKVIDQNNVVQTEYTYDKTGKQKTVKDASQRTTEYFYDSLGRLRKVVHPLQNEENFTYDKVGNRVSATDGRGKTTGYTYNELGWLTSITDPLANQTQYRYDANGNKVAVIAPNNLGATYQYDELNRLYQQNDSLNKATKFCYDTGGNLRNILDRRGSQWEYQYFQNNLLKRLDVTNGPDTYFAEYTYDPAGNRKTVTDNGNTIKYNFEDGIYQEDPLNRIKKIDRNFDGANYSTGYQYNNGGQLTKILYPQAAGWLEYKYNGLNQLNEVVGFTKPNGITYKTNGALEGITYANGVATGYGYDNNGRLSSLQVSITGKDILKLNYTYDNGNNITQINDGGKLSTYEYDGNNQLTRSVVPKDPVPLSGTLGLNVGDYNRFTSSLDFMAPQNGVIGLDYHASSIGIDFGAEIEYIKKILLVPDQSHQTHRITARSLEFYVAGVSGIYALIPATDWQYQKDDQGIITLTLNNSIQARYIKIHVKFDDWDPETNPTNKSQFLNELAKMLQVYQEDVSLTEEFTYDTAGNRTFHRVSLYISESYQSTYYPNTDRLWTNGKYSFTYDDAGNLTGKSATGETWAYRYDLLNRLIQVAKNGTIVAEYGYGPDGLRVYKKVYQNGVNTDTLHYVFEGTEPIFEKRISDGRVRSYLFALGQRLARVDGVIGEQTTFNPDGSVLVTGKPVYFYHTDHVGSVRAVTDATGTTVYHTDYQAFGGRFNENRAAGFDESLGFTGKGFDEDTGLYYYNARWYDPDLGRFISEDPAMDPNNPNLYSYCGNNPVMRVDPTGESWEGVISWIWNCVVLPSIIRSVVHGIQAGIDNMNEGGNFWVGFDAGFRNYSVTFSMSWGNDDPVSIKITFGLDLDETKFDNSWEQHSVRITAQWNEYAGEVVSELTIYNTADETGSIDPLGLCGLPDGPRVASNGSFFDMQVVDSLKTWKSETGVNGGEIIYRSNEWLRMIVPGQVAWDNSLTAWYNKRYGDSVIWGITMLGEDVVFCLSLGQSMAATKGTSIGTSLVFKNISTEAASVGSNSVYISKIADGTVQYVGITNNLARRAAEHLSQKGIQIRELMKGLSRSDARAVEQALIEIHELSKNGGTLLNQINSVAKTNPKYAELIQRGYQLLKSIGYN